MRLSFALLVLVLPVPLLAAALPTAFTYQGRLAQSGSPVNAPADVQFSLWDSAGSGSPPAGGTQIGATLVFDGNGSNPGAVQIANGLFTVQLDFGVAAFTGNARWLQIAVRSPHDASDAAAYTTLAPRQAVTPVPYALALPGLYTLGDDTAPNLIAGSNVVGLEVVAATVLGGSAGSPNSANSSYATVGGGRANTANGDAAVVGGGDNNTANGLNSAVLGGSRHLAGGNWSTVGGGFTNSAKGEFATTFGGFRNKATGAYASVAGGSSNMAPGMLATVPGGKANEAEGNLSFAAGNRAKANHVGAFVWADSTDADFASAKANTFLIRASGGVGIGTANPSNPLSVIGNSDFVGRIGIGNNAPTAPLSFGTELGDLIALNGDAGGPHFGIGIRVGEFQVHTAIASQDILFGHGSSASFTEVMRIKGTGGVGIGTPTPGVFSLAVNGDAAKPGGGSWSVFSDSRLKHDIRPLTGALDRMLGMRGYEFEYTSEAVEKRLALPGRQVGLRAEEVEKVFPDWVGKDAEGYRYVTERGTTALVVESLRELRAEKDAQINALKGDLARKDAELAALRREVEQIKSLLVTPPAMNR